MNKSPLSLEEFKSQVVADYKLAKLGSEVLRAAQRETDCRCITHSSDVAQVALAKYFRKGDIYYSSCLDLTFELATGRLTPYTFFSKLFASSLGIYTKADTGCLSVAAGSAMASKQQADPRAITVCTIGGDFAIDGNFLETVHCAVIQKLPLAIVLWNNSGDHTSGNLIKLMAGFTRVAHSSLSIQAVKGDDYASLCNTFGLQLDFTRQQCAPSLTFVDGTTGVEAFGNWLADRRILEASKVADIDNACRMAVERDRKEAYLKTLVDNEVPMRNTLSSASTIEELLSGTEHDWVYLSRVPGVVNKAIGMARSGAKVFAEATPQDIAASMLNDYPDLPICVHVSDVECAKALWATERTPICFSTSKSQTAEFVKSLMQKPEQVILIDAVGKQQTRLECMTRLGEAEVEVVGRDLTVLCFGAGVMPTIDAAKMLLTDDVSIEVVSAFSLRPFDVQGVVAASLQKTRKLMVVSADSAGATARFVLAELAALNALSVLNACPVVLKPCANQIVEAKAICDEVRNML